MNASRHVVAHDSNRIDRRIGAFPLGTTTAIAVMTTSTPGTLWSGPAESGAKREDAVMKTLRTGMLVLAAVLVIGGLTTTTQAFHDGGVATCTRCHSMHSPQDSPANGKLLTQADGSSTCLSCHERGSDTRPGSYRVSSTQNQIDNVGVAGAPIHRSPGGDFGWLKVTYTWTSRGRDNTELGETHGHNIVAAGFGYVADGTTTAPGGGASGFPSAELGCESCHDPHGKAKINNLNQVVAAGVTVDSGSYDDSPAAADLIGNETVGVYRLLRALNDTSQDGVTFTNAPVAVAPGSYNRSEADYDTRVAYGWSATGANGFEGWGEWCGTCHADMHSGTGAYTHPTDETLGDEADNYNSYVMTGQMNGTSADSYTSLVPFATSQNDRDQLKSLAATTTNDNNTPDNPDDDFEEPNLAGPGANDRVTCLSCHRAHASGFPYALRWFQDSEFITEAGAYPAANGRTVDQMQASYYDRPATVFATYQRSLCNKCHAQD
jgi:predicted CXXCH cytochrome family protein